MNNQKIIIYDSLIIHEILTEIKHNLNFDISHIRKDELASIKINEDKNYIFLTQKKISNIKNQFILDNLWTE